MRLIEFKLRNQRNPYFGVLVNQTVIQIRAGSLRDWLDSGQSPTYADLVQLDTRFKAGKTDIPYAAFPLAEVTLCAPVSRPNTLRDFYAFEQHVKTAMANRGREVPKEWYEVPVFYFSNPGTILGPDQPVRAPKTSKALDYELEIACVIGTEIRDMRAEDAERSILGYTLFNDWSARDLQRQEVAVGLGPAKAKDFASSLGPWIITPDELAPYKTDRVGVYDIPLTVRVNGQITGHGNWRDLHYSFGEMIARASADATLYPGDVIGSGTVGTGCLLETTKAQGPWLQPGDIVELEAGLLGILRTTVTSPES